MASKFPKLGPKEGFFSEFDIKYEGPATKNPLAFKYYNKDEVVLGKPMKEWLRFAVCYWHTWRGNGADIFGLGGSIKRPWDGDDMEAALTRVDVHFEFCQKLGIEYYCFHDRDVCPAEAASIEETEKDFDVVAEKMAARQAETGVKLLWGTCNLFSHPRYMHGACTNPDPAVVCRAAAAVTHCGGTVRSTREACARRLETRALELVARGRLKAEQAEALVETQRQVIQSAVYN